MNFRSLLTLVLLLCASVAMAQGPQHRGHHGQPGHRPAAQQQGHHGKHHAKPTKPGKPHAQNKPERPKGPQKVHKTASYSGLKDHYVKGPDGKMYSAAEPTITDPETRKLAYKYGAKTWQRLLKQNNQNNQQQQNKPGQKPGHGGRH